MPVNGPETKIKPPQIRYEISFESRYNLIAEIVPDKIDVIAIYLPLLYNLFQDGRGSDEHNIDGTPTKLTVIPNPANIPVEIVNILSII